MADEIIYLGDYDNVMMLRLNSDSDPLDLSSVTQITANINGVDIVSTNQPIDLIRWDQPGYLQGEIRCRFGGVDELSVGQYPCWLIMTDPTNPDGVVFDHFIVTIIALP